MIARRTHLGNAPSAAVPLVWALLHRQRWGFAELARQIGEDSGRVVRWAYGDRKPGRTAALVLSRHGISIEAWDQPIDPDWRLPHALEWQGPGGEERQ